MINFFSIIFTDKKRTDANNDNKKIEAKTLSVWNKGPDTFIIQPKPAFDPIHSATTAPITELTAATLRPEKKLGKANLIFNND